MKKNHFIFPYSGNKRNECENIYNNIKDKLDGITTIIEPFCGSSAFSVYMASKFPNRFKYILNDENKRLMELYNLLKTEDETRDLVEKLTEISKDINNEKYEKLKENDILINFVYINSVFSLRSGLFPTNRKIKTNFNDILDRPIIQFLRSEDVTIYNIDGVELLEKEKNNKDNLIFIDPPYMRSCNSYYDMTNENKTKFNIYEYLASKENDINIIKAFIVLVLEKNWIINLLFQNNIKTEYSKQYAPSKKKTTHILIDNRT